MKERERPHCLVHLLHATKALEGRSNRGPGLGARRRAGSTSFRPGVPHPMLEEKGWAHLLFDPPYVSKLASYLWSDRIIVETEVLWPVERGLLIITLGPFPSKPAIMSPYFKAGIPDTAVAWDETGCLAPSPAVS